MDMGQITQGLSLRQMQQAAAQQGINMGQLMQQGMSFGDIMLMIVQNMQNMQGADGAQLMPGMTADMQQDTGAAQFMADMQQNTDAVKLLMKMTADAQQSSDIVKILSEMTDDEHGSIDIAQLLTEASADGRKTADVLKLLSAMDNVSDMESIRRILENSNIVQNDIMPKEAQTPEQPEALQRTAEIPEKLTILNEEPETETGHVSVPDMLTVENDTEGDSFNGIKNDDPGAVRADGHSSIKADSFNDVRNNAGDDAVNVTETGRIEEMNSFEKEAIRLSENIAPDDLQKAESILEFMRSQVLNGSDALSKQFAGNFEKLMPGTQSNVISSMDFKGNASAEGLANGQKFVFDLLSSVSKDDELKDSFDFSDNVIKADPLQLAGLLDFIRTGTGIPAALDISDNTLFRNASQTDSMAGKVVFDPKEMIESGEMEIVSYTPAKHSSGQGMQDKREQEEGTIDFARTMKSVRENVRPHKADTDFNMSIAEDDETEKTDNAVTMAELHRTAQRVDISFERAYAELEMNKAKYGSADEQLAKSVAENLADGRSEFTVKLRPEGLGEILVKLVSDDAGKTVLSMVASSAKTAELLNRDLASLQSQLGTHNVEIENDRVSTAETVNPTDQAFSQFDQRRQDEGQQQNQYRHIRQQIKTDDLTVSDASVYDADDAVSLAKDDSALNIKI